MSAEQPEERQHRLGDLRVPEDRVAQRAREPLPRTARDLHGGLGGPGGLGEHLGPPGAQRGGQQRVRALPVRGGVPQQQGRDDVLEGLAAVEVDTAGDQGVGGQQREHGVVVAGSPVRTGVHASHQGCDTDLGRLAGSGGRGGEGGRTRGIQVDQTPQKFGPDLRIGLHREAVTERPVRLVGRAGHGGGPGRRLAYVAVLGLHRRQQQRKFGGHGTTGGGLVAVPVVGAALRDAAEEGEDVRGPDPGGGCPCEERHGVCRGLVHRPLVQDAAVQLGEGFRGLLVVLPRQRPQAVGHIGGTAVGVGEGGPRTGVDLGGEADGVHAVDHGTRH
ncbi:MULTISPECIES: hypothetical protein [Streptomyces]|uniref:hypothetical protein n=1 Tax=Streptomyces TaxID=1883 RepID=UPI00331A933B